MRGTRNQLLMVFCALAGWRAVGTAGGGWRDTARARSMVAKTGAMAACNACTRRRRTGPILDLLASAQSKQARGNWDWMRHSLAVVIRNLDLPWNDACSWANRGSGVCACLGRARNTSTPPCLQLGRAARTGQGTDEAIATACNIARQASPCTNK